MLTRQTRAVGRRGRLASRRCTATAGEGQQIRRILSVVVTGTPARQRAATAAAATPVELRRGPFVLPLVVAYAAAYPADDTAPDTVSCENMNKREGRTLKKKI